MICEICDGSGNVFTERNGLSFWKKCRCQVVVENLKTWQWIHSKLPADISGYIRPDFEQDNNKPKDIQKAAWADINKYDRYWIHGDSGKGKSYLSAQKIRKILMSSESFMSARYYSGYAINKIYAELYSDNFEIKREYSDLINLSKNKISIVFFDDIDKIGNMSEHKIREFSDLIYKNLDGIKYVIFTANSSIEDFCKRIPDSSYSLPLYRRMKDFATNAEIKI